MSNHQNTAQPGGTGATTPNGAKILVFATPETAPVAQNVAAAAAPPGAPQAAAPTQAPLAPNIHLDQQQMLPPPPPATQPARRIPVEELVPNVVEGERVRKRAAQHPTTGMVGMSPMHEIQEAQARFGTHAFYLPPSPVENAATTAASTPTDASSTVVDDLPSSSPINVSWDTTASGNATESSGTLSPSVRAAATRGLLGAVATSREDTQTSMAASDQLNSVDDPKAAEGTGSAAVAAPHGEEPDAVAAGVGVAATEDGTAARGVADTGATSPAFDAHHAPAGGIEGDRRTCQERARDDAAMIAAHQHAEANEVRADDDYFRHFATPPTFQDSHSATSHRNSMAPACNDENTNPADMPHGEPVREPAWQNDVQTGRKRLWTSTPNPEGERRSRRRLRPAGSTPAMRNAARLPNVASVGSNPWAEEHGAGTNQTRGSGVDGLFLPVAESSPALSSVPRFAQNLAQPSHQQRPSPHTHIAAPRPQLPLFGGLGLDVPIPRATARQRDINVQPTTYALPQVEMDVDLPNSGCDSPTPKRPRKGKGKARATAEDLQCSEQDLCPDLTQPGGWDESELLQARQESLRQTIRDRAGGQGSHSQSRMAQSEGAGPSTTARHRGGDWHGAHESDWAGREELTSRGQPNNSRGQPNNSPRSRTHHTTTNESASAWRDVNHGSGGDDARSAGVGSRTHSGFVPLPNTRAADFLANGRATLHARQQRSPSFHIPRVQRAHPPEPRDHGNGALHDREERMRQDEARIARGAWIYEGVREDDEDEGPRDGSEHHRNDGGGDRDYEDDWERYEDGEILPSALRDDTTHTDATPTPVPEGGFPTIHHDDPESRIRGMALDWMRELWGDTPHTDVLVQVYNYRYSEDDVLNGRVSEALRWAVEQITGETDFDVVPPEPEEGARRRTRDLPNIWAIRGLTPRGTAAAIERGTWSFESISFIATPRSTTMQTWLFMLEGFLAGNPQKIRMAVLRVLREESMQRWITDMISANPAFADWSPSRAMDEILDSLEVEVMQLGNGTFLANVFIRSPTRSLREWCRWVAELRARRYRSFAIGTGRDPGLERQSDASRLTGRNGEGQSSRRDEGNRRNPRNEGNGNRSRQNNSGWRRNDRDHPRRAEMDAAWAAAGGGTTKGVTRLGRALDSRSTV
ncbi:hypothetical protein C8T65DRAFT_745485 [Cerioporus squamosus]|nr:hypothetical protein C8T65DRAFT_745485 [Cerioporus squamosus]